MKNIPKSRTEDSDATSLFSRLPDEIVLQIINRLTDLKTLCFCYLVSKRFSSIVLQVEAISLSDPLINPHILDRNTVDDVAPSRPLPNSISLSRESFVLALTFLSKFKGVKSVRIELPSPVDDPGLFKWMVKFGNRIDSFIFLSPSSIFDINGSCLTGNGDSESDNELVGDMVMRKFGITHQCLKTAMSWHMMMLYLIRDLPMLEKISIVDSRRRGRLSLAGEKLNEVKESLHSPSEMTTMVIPTIASVGYIPVLKLPVSRYVMKGIYICVMEIEDSQGGNHFLKNSESGFEDAAYTEAVKEILENHMDMMHRFEFNVEWIR